MRLVLGTGVAILLAGLSAGCIVTAEPVAPSVEVAAEPPPDQRVYIYDPGYPPGCYYYGDDVYYEGRAYRRDVFVSHVVNVNIRENRYVNAEQNRRSANTYVTRDTVHYQNNHPNYRGPAGGGHPDNHRPDDHHSDDHRSGGDHRE